MNSRSDANTFSFSSDAFTDVGFCSKKYKWLFQTNVLPAAEPLTKGQMLLPYH